jgi:hypothetical protein
MKIQIVFGVLFVLFLAFVMVKLGEEDPDQSQGVAAPTASNTLVGNTDE